jgi:hypothetical protein
VDPDANLPVTWVTVEPAGSLRVMLILFQNS